MNKAEWKLATQIYHLLKMWKYEVGEETFIRKHSDEMDEDIILIMDEVVKNNN